MNNALFLALEEAAVGSYMQDKCLYYLVAVRHVGDHVGHIVL